MGSTASTLSSPPTVSVRSSSTFRAEWSAAATRARETTSSRTLSWRSLNPWLRGGQGGTPQLRATHVEQARDERDECLRNGVPEMAHTFMSSMHTFVHMIASFRRFVHIMSRVHIHLKKRILLLVSCQEIMTLQPK